MAIQVGARRREELDGLRVEPTSKRVRALLGGDTVVDSTRALLVWEPRRVVPVYAVPEEDVRAEVRAEGVADSPQTLPPVLAVGRFAVHTTPGTPVIVAAPGGAEAQGFRADDPDLDGYVTLDFDGFDAWLEEDDPIVSHPRDPFHRVDVRRSSRDVRIELDGEVLAQSSRPTLVFETSLPVRVYLPSEDVRRDLLRPSDHHTACAYKGVASYHGVQVADRVIPDLVWTYPNPLPDAAELRDLLAFWDERVDVVVDGERQPRPHTQWSP